MKELSIQEIIQATQSKMISRNQEEDLKKHITHITHDSREIQRGSLFVPIKGANVDGHDFIEGCLQEGAIASFTERESDLQRVEDMESKGILLYVADVKRAFLDLASYYRSTFDIPFIGITGSVGKTTTKDMIASILSQQYNTLATKGNYNNELGVPITLFRLESHHEVAVIEMGMNHAGEISELTKVVRPDVAVISNVGVAHIEHLKSRENILKAKCEIMEGLPEDGVVVLNGEDEMLRTLQNQVFQSSFTKKVYWCGFGISHDVYADEIDIDGLMESKCKIHHQGNHISVTIPVAGKHMIENVLLAVAVGKELGMDLERMQKGIENFVPSQNRMNVISLKNGITILNDVYNANPVSMKASLEILAKAKGRKIAVLGYMGELGKFSADMHEELGEFVARKEIDLLYYVGEFGIEVERGAKAKGNKEVYIFETREDLWANLSNRLEEQDTILVKASRSMRLEEIVQKIEDKI